MSSSNNKQSVDGDGDQLTYYLPRNPGESQRLEMQHEIVKTLFGWIVHPKLSASPNVQSVLDIATGTTIWLREARAIFPAARLVGVDLSADQFPIPPPLFISDLFIHNAVSPFPSEHIAAYDVVHQRFLVAALTRPQWDIELPNVLSLLKPGGWAQISEIDILVDEADLVSDSARLLQETMKKAAEAVNMNFQPSVDMSSQLLKAGFTNVETDTRSARLGKDSALPRDIQELGFANFDNALRSILKSMLEKGTTLGEACSSDEKIDAFADQVIADYRKNGVGYKFSVTISQRPAALK